MHVVSTINPLTKSDGDVPVVIVTYEEKRILVMRPPSFRDLVKITRKKHKIADDWTLTFQISTLDICRLGYVQIDEDVYDVLATAGLLDEIVVEAEPSEESIAVDEGESEPRPGNGGGSREVVDGGGEQENSSLMPAEVAHPMFASDASSSSDATTTALSPSSLLPFRNPPPTSHVACFCEFIVNCALWNMHEVFRDGVALLEISNWHKIMPLPMRGGC